MSKCEEIHSPGDLINNRYKILEHIGGGGQTCVYLARDTSGGKKQVIVKVLIYQSYSRQKREEELKLFSREADICQKIEHPLIPRLYDFLEENGRHYTIEEYVDGTNLDKLIRSSLDPMDSGKVLHFLSKALGILMILHSQTPPIIVRDIKPGNIVIDMDENPHFIDFTIARDYIPGKEDTVRMGSPGYAPPEQYKGMTDPRSDIYSLGATAYQMITRFDPSRKPFAMPAILEVNPGANKVLAKIIEKAISMDPEARYQDAKTMRVDVEKILAGYDKGKEAKEARRPFKHKKVLYGALSCLVLLAIIIFYAIPLWQNYNHKRQICIKNAGICYGNLASISLALDKFAADHDSKYPDQLSELTPDYIQEIPACPSAGFDTYSTSYRIMGESLDFEESGGTNAGSRQVKKRYIIYCSGNHHRDVGIKKDHPRYEKGKGLD